jgi:hypothetical protein
MGRKPQISSTVQPHVDAMIGKRADLLGLSKSNYLGEIAEWWFFSGCPALSTHEKMMLKEAKRDPKQEVAEVLEQTYQLTKKYGMKKKDLKNLTVGSLEVKNLRAGQLR